MVLLNKEAKEILLEIGVRGILKSGYHSNRHTDSASKLIFHPMVITEISKESDIEVNHRFGFGMPKMGPTHPRLGKSKFAIHGEGKFEASGKEGLTFIGPCSVLTIRNNGRFRMGKSFINSHARINCELDISIGNGCAIGWEFQLDDSNHHPVWVDGVESERRAPIKIEDNVFIGHDVTIKKGVTVHEGAIVASESVVTNDVAPETMVAGTPAEVISSEVRWEGG